MNHETELVQGTTIRLCDPLLVTDIVCSDPGGLAIPVRTGSSGAPFFHLPVLPAQRRKNPFCMNLFVEEVGTTPNSTGSQLFVDGRPFCFIIEDGYRDIKVAGETRIPAGRYQVVKHTTGKFFEKYQKDFGHHFALILKDVPDFEGILLHIGNTVKDTKGCLLVNRYIGVQASPRDYAGQDSTSVYKLLYMVVKAAFERGEEVWIEIVRRDIIDENTPSG